MDATHFDRFTKIPGAFVARREALAALIGGGLTSILGLAETAARNRGKQRRKRRRKSKRRARRGANRDQPAVCGVNQIRVNGRCVSCDVCQPSGACRFDSVQQAVAETPDGGTIRVCPGAYPTVDVLIDKELTLVGAGTGSGGTTLDAVRTGRVLRTATNGAGPVRIEQLTITGGNVTGQGGGLAMAANDDLTLVGVELTGNAASEGGGIGGNGALRLDNSHVTNNTASDNGGGIFIPGGTLVLADGTRITGNEAGNDGGGVYNLAEVKLLNGSRVSGNNAGDDGGGIENRPGASLTLESGSRVSGNKAASDGGGINNRGDATLRSDSRVEDNEAEFEGGGIRNESTLTLEAGSRVTGNMAANGGGIFSESSGTVTNNGDVSGNAPNNCAGDPAVANCAN